jgi:hypothetical protein
MYFRFIYNVCNLLQMSLPTRKVRIPSLVVDKEYRIIRVERLLISFLGDSPEYISQVLISHSRDYTDEDLRVISSSNLVYRGRIGISEFHMLHVQGGRVGCV